MCCKGIGQGSCLDGRKCGRLCQMWGMVAFTTIRRVCCPLTVCSHVCRTWIALSWWRRSTLIGRPKIPAFLQINALFCPTDLWSLWRTDHIDPDCLHQYLIKLSYLPHIMHNSTETPNFWPQDSQPPPACYRNEKSLLPPQCM